MLPYLTEFWGNTSSIYYEAREAHKGFDVARRSVARVLGARPNEVLFTSGGTESDYLALAAYMRCIGKNPGQEAVASATSGRRGQHAQAKPQIGDSALARGESHRGRRTYGKPADLVDQVCRPRLAGPYPAQIHERDDGNSPKHALIGAKEFSHFNVNVHLAPAFPLQRGLDHVRSVEEVAR